MQCSLLPMCCVCYYVNITNLNEADGDGRGKKIAHNISKKLTII